MHPSQSTFVLGTAQFGLPYGIANKNGMPDQIKATAIVQEAWENGIQEFDTAQGYGLSEQVLGKALSELGISKTAKVITKFDHNLDHLNVESLSHALDESLRRLGVPHLYGVMLHREELLSLWDNGLSEILLNFASSGRVKYIGVSVYSPDKAIQSLNTEGIDMVQLPTNILDRRFEKAGVFQLSEGKKKRIYIRSIFLQGLILTNPEEIPEKVAFARPVLEKLDSLSRRFGLTKQEIAIGYLKMKMPNAKMVFGADTPEHVKENLICWEKGYPLSLLSEVKRFFDSCDEKILNPVFWPA